MASTSAVATPPCTFKCRLVNCASKLVARAKKDRQSEASLADIAGISCRRLLTRSLATPRPRSDSSTSIAASGAGGWELARARCRRRPRRAPRHVPRAPRANNPGLRTATPRARAGGGAHGPGAGGHPLDHRRGAIKLELRLRPERLRLREGFLELRDRAHIPGRRARPIPRAQALLRRQQHGLRKDD